MRPSVADPYPHLICLLVPGPHLNTDQDPGCKVFPRNYESAPSKIKASHINLLIIEGIIGSLSLGGARVKIRVEYPFRFELDPLSVISKSKSVVGET